jgi:hypothetical protein
MAASKQPDARTAFRALAGVLAAGCAAMVLFAVSMTIFLGDWWPLSLALGALPGGYIFWRIARFGTL